MLACYGSENIKCSGKIADPGNFLLALKDWMTSEVHNGP
jgi:hypothetical protein